MKTGLNDIDIKIEITTSLESIGLSIRFLKNLRAFPLCITKLWALESYS